MALPSAQLGGMPNMNFPGYVPVVQKRPNMWEQALASFLANAAGGVASAATENAFSREYDPNAPTGVKGFLSKVAGGPRETRQMHEAETQRGFTAEQNRLSELGAATRQGRDIGARAYETQATISAADKRESARITAAKEQQVAEDAARLQLLREQGVNEQNLVRLKNELDSNDPVKINHARLLMAQAIGQETWNKGFGGVGQPPVTPPPTTSNGPQYSFGPPGAIGNWLGGLFTGNPSTWLKNPPTDLDNLNPATRARALQGFLKPQATQPATQPAAAAPQTAPQATYTPQTTPEAMHLRVRDYRRQGLAPADALAKVLEEDQSYAALRNDEGFFSSNPTARAAAVGDAINNFLQKFQAMEAERQLNYGRYNP